MMATVSVEVAARVEIALAAVSPIVLREATSARASQGPGFFLATVERTGEVGPLLYVPIARAERARGLPHQMLALAKTTSGPNEVCVIVQDLVGATEFVAATLPLST